MSTESQKPIADAFKPITSFAAEIEEAPKKMVGAFEALPNNVVLGLKYANEKLDEVVKVSADLADPVRFGEIATNLGQIPNNIDSKALNNVTAKFASGVVDNAIKTARNIFMTNPVTGIPLATGISFVNAASNVGDAVEGATKIVNDAVKKTVEKIPHIPSLPNAPPPPKILSNKGGGAKTRRHLKRVIRDRELIQTRTNKMIREFLGRATTQNKKQISKKSKRRRRR